MSGPLQVIVVSFGPGAGLQEQVLAEIDRLQGRGVMRLLDVLLVAKNDDGTIERLVVGDGDEDFGTFLASVVSLDETGFGEAAAGDNMSGFNPADAQALAEALMPGAAMALMLVEHTWAQPLMDAIAESGGAMLGVGFLTSDTGALVGAQVAAIDEAAEVIAAAQHAEAQAMLMATSAGAQAADDLRAADTIRAAAAADAVRALITAGVVREAAAHEAIDAMSTAGLIVAAANDMATEALAEGAATVRAASITLAQARVLRYLPTTLTFALIADKLGISRAAAKERAERAYKKLGVHSRAEAVSRARELGLLS